VRLKISTARMVFVSCILVLCTSYTTYAHEQGTINAYIALVAPLSGPLSEFGWSMLRAGRMRLDEDEDRGLCNAIAVKLLALDDKGNAAEALQLTRTVADNQSVVAVIGHLTTTCTLAAFHVYNSSQLIHISPIGSGAHHSTLYLQDNPLRGESGDVSGRLHTSKHGCEKGCRPP
jgi:ABC-type branched-subunit amino acid transport system substrate-binding protein